MAPFTLTALTETFLVLMNTPLVEPETSKLPRDVQLTDLPRRSNDHYREHRGHHREQDRDLHRASRRRSNDSNMSSSSHSSRSSESSFVGSSDGHSAISNPVPGVHSLVNRPGVTVDSESLSDALTTRLNDVLVSRSMTRRLTPPDLAALASKELPPLPTASRGARVHFADVPSYNE